MKSFNELQTNLNERFLTQAECRAAYYEGVKDGTIGKCPKCGSPNLSGLIAPDFESRKCDDCGKVSDQWRIQLPEDEGGAPTNNMGGGNIAGVDFMLFGGKKKAEIVGPEPSSPEDFREKIFKRLPPQ